MNVVKNIAVFYSLIVALIITIGGILTNNTNLLPQLIFLPVALYLFFSIFGKILLPNALRQIPYVQNFFLYYGFTVVFVMAVFGFVSATSLAETISAILFLPLVVYFGIQAFPRRRRALEIPQIVFPEDLKKSIVPKQLPAPKPAKQAKKSVDIDRRVFLKLIGSAGLSMFLLSLLTKRAHAAFFGSVPGPGTVALKDTSGTQIDPAQHHPTDGYKISEIDDSSPAFYGFLRKDGAWFIMKEGTSGDYRYAKGSSNFSTNWTNRSSLTYDYFDNVF